MRTEIKAIAWGVTAFVSIAVFFLSMADVTNFDYDDKYRLAQIIASVSAGVAFISIMAATWIISGMNYRDKP